MRILVCGGRNFADRILLDGVLGKLLRAGDVLVHGGARGADRLAGAHALLRGLLVEAYVADWETYGKSAGPIRNREMLATKPDLVICFPGGPGTADMQKIAVGAKIPVVVVTGQGVLCWTHPPQPFMERT